MARKRAFSIRVVFLLGAASALLLTVLARAALYEPEAIHYHANFAVYVNGQREEFKEFTNYQEVASCDVSDSLPEHRVHLHQPASDIVHVHADGVTWGHFFQVLDIQLDSDLLRTKQGLFVETDGRELTYILNGKEVSSVTNRLIASTDRLLVSYGSESDAQLTSRFDSVAKTAPTYNEQADPAACSGSGAPTLLDRLRHAVQL